MPTYAGWRRSITSDTGIVVPNAQIEVFNAGELTKPTLYADPEGVTELTNPFDADAEGFAEFYVTGGFYRIEAGAEGADGIWDWVAIGTAQGLDAGEVVAPGDLADVATSGDHVDLLNKGVNTHAQIDTHIAATDNPHDTTLSNLGDTGAVSYTNRHCLIADGTSYVGRALVEADISDLQNYALVSSLSDVATSGDHADLSGIGVNTHAQIDSHIADDDKHREINDSGSGATDLWSAEKISAEIGSVDAGTVTTGTSIDGDGSAGSPLEVADDAIGQARLSPGVRSSLKGAYLTGVVTEETDPPLSGTINLNPLDTAQLDLSFSGITVSSGIVSLLQDGFYHLNACMFVEGTEIIDGRVVVSIVGGSDIITVPFTLDSGTPSVHVPISAAFRLSSADDIVFSVEGSSASSVVLREGTHVSIVRIAAFDI